MRDRSRPERVARTRVYYYLELIQHDAAVERGFLAPGVSWFQGQSIEFVRCKLMKDGHGKMYNSLDKEAFESQVGQPLSDEQNRTARLVAPEC